MASYFAWFAYPLTTTTTYSGTAAAKTLQLNNYRNQYQIRMEGMKTNRFNDKVVKREEWTTSKTVTITYTDGSKEVMSRKSFEQIIKE